MLCRCLVSDKACSRVPFSSHLLISFLLTRQQALCVVLLDRVVPLGPFEAKSYDSAPFISTASISNARKITNLPCCKHESGSPSRKRTLEGATIPRQALRLSCLLPPSSGPKFRSINEKQSGIEITATSWRKPPELSQWLKP